MAKNESGRVIMLKTKQAIILTCSMSWLLIAGTIDASDPCKPDRKFCGRITVYIGGAGDASSLTRGVKGVDADLNNVNANYTYSNFHQFRGTDINGMPSYSIVIENDPTLKRKLENLPQTVKDESHFLGIKPATYDAFQDLLSTDKQLSLIEQAVDNFRHNSDCQKLAGKDGDILPFLKVEIVIESQNANGGIPLWSDKNQSGPLWKWEAQPDPKALDKDLIAKLRARLGGSVVQTFIGACDGGKIGDNFETKDECSCYLSLTGPGTLIFVGGDRPSFFSGTMPDKGLAMRALKAKSQGAPSVAEMSAQLNSNLETYMAVSGDRTGFDPIFAAGSNINPLLSFLYNSADSRAEKILAQLDKEKVAGSRPGLLLSAGFSEQLPEKIGVSRSGRESPELKKILEITALLRNVYVPYTKDVATPQKNSTFEDEMNKFRNCATSKKPPEPPVCAAIGKLVNIAEAGTEGGGMFTLTDRTVLKATEDFFAAYESNETSSLITKYSNNEESLTTLFETLGSLWKNFDAFRTEVTRFSEIVPERYKPPPKADADAAIREMRSHFNNAMFSVQKQFFQILRKNALEVRLARIEEAAKLLETHQQDLASLNAKEELRLLGNELACLTYYPVGPAFDKLKFSAVPIANSEISSKSRY